MVLSNMVNLSDSRTSYNFTAQVGKFMFTGTCVFDSQKLIEASGNATVSVEDLEDPETEEQVREVGVFNYNYYYDERENYSFYIDETLSAEYYPAILTLLSEIRAKGNISE